MYTWYFKFIFSNGFSVDCRGNFLEDSAEAVTNKILRIGQVFDVNARHYHLLTHATNETLVTIHIEDISVVQTFTPEQWEKLKEV